MVEFELSSNISAVEYFEAILVLHIRFKSGATYEYHGVIPEEYAALLTASSKGKWVHENLQLQDRRGIKLPSISTGGATWKADDLTPVLEDSLRLNVLQDEGCCGNAAIGVHLNRMYSFVCPKCGLEWLPEIVEEIRNWKATPIAVIV